MTSTAESLPTERTAQPSMPNPSEMILSDTASAAAQASGMPQLWEAGGCPERTGVDRGDDTFGLGDDADAVAAVRPRSPHVLIGYLGAATDALCEYASDLSDQKPAEVIDESYDPPVTRTARIVSITGDAQAHVAQAEYVRGLLDRWRLGV